MRNDKPLKTRVLVSSIILMFMVLCDIYMIVSIPQNFQLLAIAAFITFLWMTFTLDGWMSLRELASREREEQYQDILKAEKASYLIFQQKFQDLDNKLNFIGQKIMPLEKSNIASQKRIASMLDGLGEEQKKIAKILISRSKENADALINSNGQLMGHMNDLLQSVSGIDGIGAVGQGGAPMDIQSIQEAQKEILAKLQEIVHLLESGSPSPSLSPNEMEALLSGMDGAKPGQAAEMLFANAGGDGSVAVNQAEDAQPAEEMKETMEKPSTEAVGSAKEEPSIEAAGSAKEEPSIEAAGSAMAAEPAFQALAESAKGAEAPSQAAGLEAAAQEAARKAQEAAEVIRQASQAAGQQAAQAAAEQAAQAAAEQAAQAQQQTAAREAQQPSAQKSSGAQAKPAAPAKPNPADPNRMMSPEDIAALIANAAVEELPDAAPEIEEEKPPKPEISDPNKMMSPEEIAALIANM